MIDKYITDKRNCSGCTACFAVCPKNCISMEPDQEGFSYPVVDHSKCIECNACVRTCPIQNKYKGQMLDAYALYNINKHIRKQSASGGFFYALAHHVISVLNGVVFGARYDDSMNVIHAYTTTIEGIKPFMGSKYVDSDLKNTFHEVKQFLQTDVFVLYTGMPCQIAGLKAYLNKDYSNLITMDIFCFGVASPMIFSKYLKEKDNANDIIDFKFRSKDISWYEFGTKVIYADGTEIFGNRSQDDYMYLYFNKYFYRPACYKCSFKNKDKVSDFFVGDYWNIQNVHRSMYDKYGVSAVFVNTEKGRTYFDKIASQFNIQTTTYDYIHASNMALDTSGSIPKYHKIAKLLINYFKVSKVVKVLKSLDYDD